MATAGSTVTVPDAAPDVAARYRWRRRAPVLIAITLGVVVLAMFYSIGVTAYPVAAALFVSAIALLIAMVITSHWANHVYPVIAAHAYATHADAQARAQFAADWQHALHTARVLRANLITDAELPACDPGSIVLADGERVEVWADVTYAPYYDADPTNCAPITVAATSHRVIALTERGVIAHPWTAVRALTIDPTTALLAIDFDATTTLVLTGPQTLPLAVYAAAKVHGTDHLLTNPTMLRLGPALATRCHLE